MNKFRNIIVALLLGAVSFIAQSCVCEDTSECKYSFVIDLTYHTVDKGAGIGDHGAQDVRVFLYDSNGDFVKTHTESIEVLKQNGYKIEVPIEIPGAYRFVVLGGAQSQSYQITDGTIQTYDVKLKDLEQNTQIENMFATTADSVAVLDGSTQVVEKDIFKNNNDIHFIVDVDGVSNVTIKNLKLEVKDRNYNQYNEITSDDTMIYTPYYYGDDTVKVNKMRIMSLSQNTIVSFDLYVNGVYWTTQEPIDISTFLYDYVKESSLYTEYRKDDNYQYILDIEDTYPIVFRYKTCPTCPPEPEPGNIPVLVEILIMDWKVIFVTPLPL